MRGPNLFSVVSTAVDVHSAHRNISLEDFGRSATELLIKLSVHE